MHWHTRDDGVTILHPGPGRAGNAAAAHWLAHQGAGRVFRLDCRQQAGGPWAGLSALIAALLPELRERAGDLVARHAHELSLLIPSLKLEYPRSLTDVADGEEKTRNYPADRAYRHLHGLIDLLAAWDERTRPGGWAIACDGYDDASPLVRRFFDELMRRRGAQLGLRLLLVRGGTPAAPGDPVALEATLPADPALRATRLPRLIEAWRASATPERATRWQLLAMGEYNHDGLYEASLRYAGDIEAALDRLYREDRASYFAAVNILYFTYVPLGRATDAARIFAPALARAESRLDRARYGYLLAMLHARFLPEPDQDRAERLLYDALDELAGAGLGDAEREFHTVFTLNGLAFVRLRQRRVQDALELCRDGVARLNAHLDPHRHRLHRSVLLFNIAQVHAQIGPYEDALAHFTQAMEMDPNYSEYFNDRGSVHLKLGRLEAAEADFRRAIALSPPYPEVWTNLGQCYRAMGRLPDADHAYSRALDLDPDAALALVGRAETRADLGDAAGACADYDRALALEPGQPLVLACRAVLHYDDGRLEDSVRDLDAALALAPDVAELYQNRAVALEALDRPAEAARDLHTYLELCPDADDRSTVEHTLASLAPV